MVIISFDKRILFKRIKKIRNYFPLVNFSMRCWFSKAAIHRCFTEKVFLKILQYSQKNTCAGLCRSFFYRPPGVTASAFLRHQIYFFSWIWHLLQTVCRGFCSELVWKHELNLKSSQWNTFVKKGVLRNFANFHNKTSELKSLFNRVVGLQAWSFVKMRLQRRCLPLEFTNF